jgi:hypothetical protein
LSAAPSKGIVPPELTPLRFKLANASNSKVIGGILVIYVLVGGILLSFYSAAGQSITPASFLQILGIGGDGFSVAILIFSTSVKHYSLQTYVSSFDAKAKRKYPDAPPEVLRGMLAEFHGYLQNTTGNILKNEIGGILIAISTTLGLIGAVLRGG